MPKAIPSPNLTAVLALAALADLLLYRLGTHVFLPSQPVWGVARVLSDLGLFMSNLGGVLGVVLVAMVLLRALRGDTIFPRSMRITVSTIGSCPSPVSWRCRFLTAMSSTFSSATRFWPGWWQQGCGTGAVLSV